MEQNTNVKMIVVAVLSVVTWMWYEKRQSKKQEQEQEEKILVRRIGMENDLLLKEEEEEEKKVDCIYLDYNGTTPIEKSVLDAMMPYLTTEFGNPSSTHYYGQKPRMAIQEARQHIATLIGATDTDDDCIIFTGCGTEADNMAIHMALSIATSTTNPRRSIVFDKNQKPHIVTSAIEHPAILAYLQSLEDKGEVDVTYVKVNKEGLISVIDVIDAIDVHRTILVTIMYANNEVGSIQPIQDIALACNKLNILFHTDAAQAIGKVVPLPSLQHIDMMTIVGHKLGAPKGIAALYIRPTLTPHSSPFLMGGGQERGLRAGTENVPYIVGMGQAAKLLLTTTNNSGEPQWQCNMRHMKQMRQRLLQHFQQQQEQLLFRVNGPSNEQKRLPNTLSISIKGLNSAKLVQTVGNVVACSAGSACHASDDTKAISPVLRAMNVPLDYALGTLRLTIGPHTTPQQIDTAAQILIQEIKYQLSSLPS